MEILLITAGRSCGKSEVIVRTAGWLQHTEGYRIVRTFHSASFLPFVPGTSVRDCEILLEKNGKYVLVHAATDDAKCVGRLHDNLDLLATEGTRVDVLLTSCRRFDDPMRRTMAGIMGWSGSLSWNVLSDTLGRPIQEFPLLHIRYDHFPSVDAWYKLHACTSVRLLLKGAPYRV